MVSATGGDFDVTVATTDEAFRARSKETGRHGSPASSYSNTTGMNFVCRTLAYSSCEKICDSVPTPPERVFALSW